MSKDQDYTPPKIWRWSEENGGKFASINRPIAGATHEKPLPQGENPLQLYSLATPNGQKVTIMLEELIEAGHSGAEYDAYLINIQEGDQFGSGFVELNPNSKIPALFDTTKSVRVFESGAILLYLAKKFQAFLPEDHTHQTEVMNWVFWLQGSAPYLGGGFGHFYAYAPFKSEYAINRFSMEAKRQLDVLERELSKNDYLGGDLYTIADMLTVPWYGALVKGLLYDAAEFLSVSDYPHVMRWADKIFDRPAVERGRKVNRAWGEPWEQLPERHSPSDFETIPKKP